MVFVELTGGVVAARPSGSDDVDSVEITVGRLAGEVEVEMEDEVVEKVVVEEDADVAVVTVVVVVEVVVVVVSRVVISVTL